MFWPVHLMNCFIHVFNKDMPVQTGDHMDLIQGIEVFIGSKAIFNFNFTEN